MISFAYSDHTTRIKKKAALFDDNLSYQINQNNQNNQKKSKIIKIIKIIKKKS